MLPPNLARALAKGTVMSCYYYYDQWFVTKVYDDINVSMSANRKYWPDKLPNLCCDIKSNTYMYFAPA